MIDGAAAAVQRYPGESIGGPGGKAVKKTLGALAAVILALMLFSPPAEARCWWNGWRWQCHHAITTMPGTGTRTAPMPITPTALITGHGITPTPASGRSAGRHDAV
jgi:hypothetical protein